MPILGVIASSKLSATTNAYDFIALADVTSSVSSITLSSIPQTYQHLQLRYIGRNGRTADQNGFLGLQVNGSYLAELSTMLYSSGAEPIGLDAVPSSSTGYQIMAPGSQANAAAYGTGVLDFVNYASTSQKKTVRTIHASQTGGSSALVALATSYINSTAAISSITITGIDGANVIAGSKFYLYGLKV